MSTDRKREPRVRIVGTKQSSNQGNNQAVEKFVQEITSVWQESVVAIIKTGRLLIHAKEELKHGEWLKMFGNGENKLPFGERTAQRLMLIAKHPILSNPTHVSHLPASWGTLYELTALDEPELQRLIETGQIKPDMERKDVKDLGFHKFEAAVAAFDVLANFMQRMPPEELAEHVHWHWKVETQLRSLSLLPDYIREFHTIVERKHEESRLHFEEEIEKSKAAARKVSPTADSEA